MSAFVVRWWKRPRIDSKIEESLEQVLEENRREELTLLQVVPVEDGVLLIYKDPYDRRDA